MLYRKGRTLTCATEKQLAAIRDRADRETDKVAAAVRRKYVIPFCKRHGMRFTAGMGSWSLDKVGGRRILWNDDDLAGMPGAARMLEALTTELPTNPGQHLGSIMEDYAPC